MTHEPAHAPYPMSARCRAGIEKLLDLPRGLLLGLTGGVASGKSTVASMLVERGAVVVDFDDLAREVVEPGTPALDEIREIFGGEVINAAGALDRKGLARVVFSNPDKRARLEAAVHPRIFDLYLARAAAVFDSKPDAVLVAVIPLLAELGLWDLFHAAVLVYAPAAVQKERLMARDGISADQAEKMLQSQMPMDEKLRLAGFVVHNDAGLHETGLQVGVLWREFDAMRRGREGCN